MVVQGVNNTAGTLTYSSEGITIAANSTVTIPTSVLINFSSDPSVINDITLNNLSLSDTVQTYSGAAALQFLNVAVTYLNNYDRFGSGTISALNGTVTASTSGASTLVFAVSGTWVGTIFFKGVREDGTTEYLYGNQIQFGSDLSFQNYSTNGTYIVNCAGFATVSLKAEAYTSGTISVGWNASVGQNIVKVYQPTAASLQATAAQGAPTTLANAWPIKHTDGTYLNTIFPDGEARVQASPKQLFFDTYDTGLDTTNRYNSATASGGGVAATNIAGSTTLGTGTTANGYSYLTTQATFAQQSPGWLKYFNAINLQNPIPANTYLSWGVGNPQATPTAASPYSNFIGYEVTTAGKMMVVSYASTTRTVIQDLSASTGNNTQPTDSAVHKYFMWFRGDLAYFAIDTLSNIVATMPTGATGPIVNSLPMVMMVVAGSSAPASSGTIQSNASWMGDTAGNSSQLSDGTFAWRKAKIGPLGDLQTNTKTVITPSSPTAATVGITSAQALASNANRKGLILTNTSTAKISLGLGSAAVLSSGITLYPGGVWVMDEFNFTTNAINAIASLASSNLAIQEFTT